MLSRRKTLIGQCGFMYFRGPEASGDKEESLAKAKEIAEDWYLKLRGKLRSGEIKTEKTFREVSAHYLHEYDIMTQGQRNQRYVDGQRWRSSVHLVPFFGNLGISEITAGTIQEYRVRKHHVENRFGFRRTSGFIELPGGGSKAGNMTLLGIEPRSFLIDLPELKTPPRGIFGVILLGFEPPTQCG